MLAAFVIFALMKLTIRSVNFNFAVIRSDSPSLDTSTDATILRPEPSSSLQEENSTILDILFEDQVQKVLDLAKVRIAAE